ncbi:hypothetical protein GOP47_0015903 [Adiantum capillus-veneris]|uniref:Ubiquitin thioesterase OTU n=1 Tax=Adiantum capillus-veneris TaxID=13818 RepID=A0A9D4UKV2_ADICA|nr:hypothetical protein GOP47_0015903 [Adiantum capillus-veneris]
MDLQKSTAGSQPLSAEKLMRELADGTATFELKNQRQETGSANFFTSVSLAFMRGRSRPDPCFARIGSLVGAPPFAKKIEHYAIHRIKGDGRCMFRALALGMAFNDGFNLSPNDERNQADNLRTTVKDALCSTEKNRQKYEEALIAITIDESINRYCRRIRYPDFWGGESELLVLSRIYQQPIIVYIPEHETKGFSGSWRSGFVPIAQYGSEFLTASKEVACKPVRLLFSGSNHYDLLI